MNTTQPSVPQVGIQQSRETRIKAIRHDIFIDGKKKTAVIFYHTVPNLRLESARLVGELDPFDPGDIRAEERKQIIERIRKQEAKTS